MEIYCFAHVLVLYTTKQNATECFINRSEEGSTYLDRNDPIRLVQNGLVWIHWSTFGLVIIAKRLPGGVTSASAQPFDLGENKSSAGLTPFGGILIVNKIGCQKIRSFILISGLFFYRFKANRAQLFKSTWSAPSLWLCGTAAESAVLHDFNDKKA